MPSPIFISRPPAGFTLLGVVRGLQLTILGGYRALKNPELARTGYYRKAVNALVWSLAIQVVLWAPFILVKWTLYAMRFFSSHDDESIDESIQSVRFWQHALNLGPLLISGMRYIRPEMDELFLTSLHFVDQVYKRKHPDREREFYPWLVKYDNEARKVNDPVSKDSLNVFLQKYGKRMATTIGMYMLSGVPGVGRFILPVVSFYSFNQVVGTPTASTIFSIGLFIPRRHLLLFLSAFWGGRSLARELLAPYFNRIPFSKIEKEQWFTAREGIMFGFGAGFYLLLRIPFVGVLVYGFAEASAAYLITKVTDPPPPPEMLHNWTASQTVWTRNDVLLSGNEFANDGF